MNRPLQYALQGAALTMFFLFGTLFIFIAMSVRPDFSPWDLLRAAQERIRFLLSLLGLTYLMVFLHEAVHGLFFWLFTREWPLFGLKRSYAYAAAPAWYLPRGPMLVTGLAPLLLLTVAGLLLMLFLPVGWLPALLLVITLNAAGAVGDLVTAVLLLREPATVLANDQGDVMRLYRNGKGKVKGHQVGP